MQKRTASSLPIQTSTSSRQKAAHAPGAGVAYVLVPRSALLADVVPVPDSREGLEDWPSARDRAKLRFSRVVIPSSSWRYCRSSSLNSPIARHVDGVRFDTFGGVNGFSTADEPSVTVSYCGANAEGPALEDDECESEALLPEDLLNLDMEGETHVDILLA